VIELICKNKHPNEASLTRGAFKIVRCVLLDKIPLNYNNKSYNSKNVNSTCQVAFKFLKNNDQIENHRPTSEGGGGEIIWPRGTNIVNAPL